VHDSRERAVNAQGTRLAERIVGGSSRDGCLHIESPWNRQRDDGKTSFEAWFGFRPSVVYLRPFGCDIYLIIPERNGKKLHSKSCCISFVGYSETEKNFHVFDRERRKVFVSCNLKFNETKTTPITDAFYGE